MPDNKHSRPRRRKKRSALYGPISFVVICAAMLFGMSVFFRVTDIQVEGNTRYSAQDIIEASGVEEGDNLFFVNRFTVASKIHSKLPYVEEVTTVDRQLPNRLVITVRESVAVACVVSESGELWAIDRNCKLLSSVDMSSASVLIQVQGVTVLEPVVGEIMTTDQSDAGKTEFLSELLYGLISREMTGNVKNIDMSNAANPAFDYLDRFTVRMGKNEDVDYKFELLLSAVQQLAAGDSGTIDLSVDKQAHFTYD